jgi:hypothetical protein
MHVPTRTGVSLTGEIVDAPGTEIEAVAREPIVRQPSISGSGAAGL